MKVDPTMYMKTKASSDKMSIDGQAFYMKMQQFLDNRQQSAGLLAENAELRGSFRNPNLAERNWACRSAPIRESRRGSVESAAPTPGFIHPITQSPDLPIPLVPVTHFPKSVIGRERTEDEGENVMASEVIVQTSHQ